MALTKKDLLEFGQILKEDLKQEFTKMWRTDLRIALEQQSQDIKRDIRDEMDARFVAFRGEFSTFKQEIRTEIAETITDTSSPQ
jgi:hypothetical protein